MGLMLSVLVFCVGVAEILDCWHHFLLHLVQPQYNALPSHLDIKADYLSDREILHPQSDSRRTSNVDICWPKDLSPDDNLHVIKKRHGEVDPDPSHRAVRKHPYQERDTSPVPKCHRNAESLLPDIEVHSPEPSDVHTSPHISRETSPNRLELGVIVESDSSSEVDEPSQIENINFKKKENKDDAEQDEELSVLCRGEILPVIDTSRPRCPSAKILEELDIEPILKGSEVKDIRESETSSQDLPVFTDTIISQDITKVEVHYPRSTEASNVLAPSSSPESGSSKIKFGEDVNTSEFDQTQKSPDPNHPITIPPISSLLTEGLEPIPEFPEIKIQSSSPLPLADDSDSSLNTSDASWMVRSKTSDRPLIIRFDTSPEKVQKDFQSVVQTDLRALADKVSPIKSIVKAESVDEYYDALINQDNEGGYEKYKNDFSNEENVNRVENIESTEVHIEVDVKPPSVNAMQIESNSSSSSLSGIPPLPEDTSEYPNRSSFATDSSFSQASDLTSTDLSVSRNDDPKSSVLTNDNSNKERLISDQPKPIKMENSKIEPNLDNQSVKSSNVHDDKSIGMQPENSVEAVSFENSSKKYQEKLLEISERNEKGISREVDFTNSFANEGREEPVPSEVALTSLKDVGTASMNTNSAEKKPPDVTSPIDNKPEIKMNNITVRKTVEDPATTETTSTSNESKSKALPVNENKTEKTKVLSDSTELSTGSENIPCPKTDVLEKSNIPKDSSASHKPTESLKETSTTPKTKSSKKTKTKSISKKSSPENSDAVVVCGAQESDTETRQENRAASASVASNLPNDSRDSKSDLPVKAGPSQPIEEAKSSTSKREDDKAFWLIFSGEYTKAMNKDWHSGHFCCWQCDESLTGQRYVLRDEHPYCVKCYESVFANGCEECNKIIGIDSKDLSYKDKHWHEACFLCNKCRVSLVDKQFGSKLDKIFCGNCYDQQFASRCDGCGQIFKAGTKKMEYKTRQWHEPCFACCVCKSPIGTKSFIPREQEIYCATCYEEKFATRCVKCNKIITSGGVTYKNEPWHRECFTCTNCNTSLAGQRFTSRDEKPYCAECFGELFAKRCTACSKPITGIGGTRFISFEDRHWHNDCFICASCKTSLVGRGFITDGDDIICPECAKQKLM